MFINFATEQFFFHFGILGTSHYLCRGGVGWEKNRGAKAILNEQRGGAIVFFWYKDKGKSYDSARFMRRYI